MPAEQFSASAVDLYAGAGGLSLGLEMAGVTVRAAVEADAWAADTHALNLPRSSLYRQRVSDLGDDFFRRYRGIDIVAGGPPCQGFSISASNRRSASDPRNEEVFRFVETAIRLKPQVILLENVPEIIKYKFGEQLLIDLLRARLRDAGYGSSAWVVNCADFGVPQHRRRFFLIASPHAVADLTSAQSHAQLGSSSGLPAWLTVRDAIADLPVVVPRTISEDAWIEYSAPPSNPFQRATRHLDGGCYNHVPMRHSPRLIDRFAVIEAGDNGSAVWDLHPATARGDRTKLGTKFAQNHRRLRWDASSPTITAYMYSTCLHPSQHRNITVREAARLQTFPDYFRFLGKRTTLSNKLLARKGLQEDMGLNQLNQVGNAVPPLMGKVLGTVILEEMKGLHSVECA